MIELPQGLSDDIAVEQDGESVTIILLPPGLGANLRVLGMAGLLVLAGGVGFLLQMLVFGPMLTLSVAAMSLVGLGVFAAAVALTRATQRAIIDLTPDLLMVTWGHLFSKQQHQWQADRLKSIDVTVTVASMDHHEQYELQIYEALDPLPPFEVSGVSDRDYYEAMARMHHTDHRTRMLAGWPSEDLIWIAEAVRSYFNMPSSTQAPS